MIMPSFHPGERKQCNVRKQPSDKEMQMAKSKDKGKKEKKKPKKGK